jgi:hypothetical protein
MFAMRNGISAAVCAILAVVCLASIARAQMSWWRTCGGTSFDEGYSVQETADGGYIIAGYTWSFGSSDVYLIKTNASGDSLWARNHGGREGSGGYSVQQTADGGYIITGGTNFRVAARDSADLYLIKTNASGDSLWARAYGGSTEDNGLSVQQTADGGYIIAGYTESFGVGTPDSTNVYLIKTDASGDTLWTRTYGGTKDDRGYSVRQTADGGYIVAGYTMSFGAGRGAYLIRTDASGDTLWTRSYGGPGFAEGRSVQQTADGGYIIAGSTGSFGAGGADVYLIKIDSDGETLWTRTCGGTNDDWGYSVQQTADGGFIIAGYTSSLSDTADRDVYLIKTNATGDTLWTRTFGGTSFDEGYSVQQTADGGYIIAGYTVSFGAGSRDVYLIKTDSSGNVGVAERIPKPQVISRKLVATVFRSIPRGTVAFDALGRRALNRKPGIYFVREAQAQAQALRKVVLVR